MKVFKKALLMFIVLFLVMALNTEIIAVDINSASEEELQDIIWVGPVHAEKIVNNRPFNSINDLTQFDYYKAGGARMSDIREEGIAHASSSVEQEGEITVTLTARERAVLLIENETISGEIFGGNVDFDESDYVADTGIKVNANVDVDLQLESSHEGFGEEFLDEWVEFHLTDNLDKGHAEGHYEANVSPADNSKDTWGSFVGPGSKKTNFGVWVEIPEAGEIEDGGNEGEWYDFEAGQDNEASDTVTLTVSGAN